MSRELRVRSPLNVKHGASGPIPAVGTKRKYPEPDSFLRRSMRGYSDPDYGQTSDPTVRARFDGRILTVSGVPSDALAENSDESDHDDENASESQDVATWEEKWMGSPTKRRRVERMSYATHNDPERDSRGRLIGKRRKKARPHAADQSATRPRLKAIERLSRSIKYNSTEPRSEGSSPRPSRNGSSRQTSVAPTRNGNADGQVTPGPSDRNDLEEDGSVRSSVARSISPPASYATTPEAEEPSKIPTQTNIQQKEPDEIDPHDLPPPLLDITDPESLEIYEDEAERILRTTHPAIPPPQRFIQALTSHHPSKRSTLTLKLLAENAQRALRVWQDEFVRLDKRTAPVSLPFAKKPCTGGRIPISSDEFELEKYKDLYGDGSKLAAAMGLILPSTGRTRNGNGTPMDGINGGGRELRRRGADTRIIDGLGISSDDAGAKKPTRARKPVRRFDVGHNATDSNGASSKAATNGKAPAVRRAVPPAGIAVQEQPKAQRRRRAHANNDKSVANHDDHVHAPNDDVEVGEVLKSAIDRAMQDPKVESGPTAIVDGTNGHAVPEAAANHAEPPEPPAAPMSPATAAAEAEKKARAKSLKRSESMTAWWAQRKRKQAEDQIKDMHARGEFREGVWNVDTIKAWAPVPDGNPPTSAAAYPSPGAVMDPQYAAWMAAHDPHHAAWMASMWTQPPPPNGAMQYAYPPYPWPPPQTPGGHYDPRMYGYPPPPPLPPKHASRDQARQSTSSASKPHARQPSTNGPNQPLTPSHPFAHPPHPPHMLPQGPPSRQGTPLSAQIKQSPVPTPAARHVNLTEPYPQHYQYGHLPPPPPHPPSSASMPLYQQPPPPNPYTHDKRHNARPELHWAPPNSQPPSNHPPPQPTSRPPPTLPKPLDPPAYSYAPMRSPFSSKDTRQPPRPYERPEHYQHYYPPPPQHSPRTQHPPPSSSSTPHSRHESLQHHQQQLEEHRLRSLQATRAQVESRERRNSFSRSNPPSVQPPPFQQIPPPHEQYRLGQDATSHPAYTHPERDGPVQPQPRHHSPNQQSPTAPTSAPTSRPNSSYIQRKGSTHQPHMLYAGETQSQSQSQSQGHARPPPLPRNSSHENSSGEGVPQQQTEQPFRIQGQDIVRADDRVASAEAETGKTERKDGERKVVDTPSVSKARPFEL